VKQEHPQSLQEKQLQPEKQLHCLKQSQHPLKHEKQEQHPLKQEKQSPHLKQLHELQQPLQQEKQEKQERVVKQHKGLHSLSQAHFIFKSKSKSGISKSISNGTLQQIFFKNLIISNNSETTIIQICKLVKAIVTNTRGVIICRTKINKQVIISISTS